MRQTAPAMLSPAQPKPSAFLHSLDPKRIWRATTRSPHRRGPYAWRLVSSPGKDGLYWEPVPGESGSPL